MRMSTLLPKLTSPFSIALGAAFVLPLSSFGQIPYGLNLSCNNGMLVGSYSGQMNISDTNVVTDLNATATPESATDAGFGSTTGPAASTALNNSKSKLLGMSRYYFDGNGNIVGAVSPTPAASLLSVLRIQALPVQSSYLRGALQSIRTAQRHSALLKALLLTHSSASSPSTEPRW